MEAEWGLSKSGRRRRYYHLTPNGRAQLAEQGRQWRVVDEAFPPLFAYR